MLHSTWSEPNIHGCIVPDDDLCCLQLEVNPTNMDVLFLMMTYVAFNLKWTQHTWMYCSWWWFMLPSTWSVDVLFLMMTYVAFNLKWTQHTWMYCSWWWYMLPSTWSEHNIHGCIVPDDDLCCLQLEVNPTYMDVFCLMMTYVAFNLKWTQHTWMYCSWWWLMLPSTWSEPNIHGCIVPDDDLCCLELEVKPTYMDVLFLMMTYVAFNLKWTQHTWMYCSWWWLMLPSTWSEPNIHGCIVPDDDLCCLQLEVNPTYMDVLFLMMTYVAFNLKWTQLTWMYCSWWWLMLPSTWSEPNIHGCIVPDDDLCCLNLKWTQHTWMYCSWWWLMLPSTWSEPNIHGCIVPDDDLCCLQLEVNPTYMDVLFLMMTYVAFNLKWTQHTWMYCSWLWLMLPSTWSEPNIHGCIVPDDDLWSLCTARCLTFFYLCILPEFLGRWYLRLLLQRAKMGTLDYCMLAPSGIPRDYEHKHSSTSGDCPGLSSTPNINCEKGSVSATVRPRRWRGNYSLWQPLLAYWVVSYEILSKSIPKFK